MESTGTQQALATTSEQINQPQYTSKMRWVDLALVLLIAIGPPVLNAVLILIYSSTAPPGNPVSTKMGVISALLHQFISLVTVAYVLRRQGRGIREIGFGFAWTDPLKGIALAIGGLLLSALLSFFVQKTGFLVAGSFAGYRDPRTIFTGFTPSLFLLYLTASSIFEETVVRGFLTTEMIGLARPIWLATLTSIVLQTSYHLYYGVAGALIVSGSFIVFALYFARSRRLLPVIIGHVCV